LSLYIDRNKKTTSSSINYSHRSLNVQIHLKFRLLCQFNMYRCENVGQHSNSIKGETQCIAAKSSLDFWTDTTI
jgi:hypothetical protein